MPVVSAADWAGATLHDQPLVAVPFVFVDLETTGLLPAQGDRICEVALLRVRGEVVEATFEHLVDPQRALGERAFAVNHITPEMLQGQPTFAAIADAVLEIIQGAVLVAHNAPFDTRFLAYELARLGYPAPRNPTLDTLALAQRLLVRSSYSLEAFAHDLGLPPPTHRAMSDVLTLRELFASLTTEMAEYGITTLADALRCQRGLLPDEPEPEPPPLVAQALHEQRRLRIVYSSRSTPVPTERLIQPIELMKKWGKLHLRAYCYLRNDLRSFVIEKIERMELE
jgi:DNA polymerase-3 subunit epsilon